MLVLIGESASGKSTIEKELVKLGMSKITSYTTRPKRDGEVDGIDYHFITDAEFEYMKKNGRFAEHTEYRKWHYAIAKEDCIDDAVVVLEPRGYHMISKIPGLHIVSFYILVDDRERMIRMIQRGDDISEAYRRWCSDQGVFQGIWEETDFLIGNERLPADMVAREIKNKYDEKIKSF